MRRSFPFYVLARECGMGARAGSKAKAFNHRDHRGKAAEDAEKAYLARL